MATELSTIEVLDASGHLSLTWNPNDPADVARARKEVENLKAAGYGFFRVLPPEEAIDQGGGELIVSRVDDPVAPGPVLVPDTDTDTAQGGKLTPGGDTLHWEPGQESEEPVEAEEPEEPTAEAEAEGPPGVCRGTTQAGNPCKRKASSTGFCGWHQVGRTPKAKPQKGKKHVAVRQMRGG